MIDQKQLENVEILNNWVALYQKIEDALVKLNVGLLWLKLHSTRKGSFY